MENSCENKHVPMRMCAITHEKLPKKELIRIALQDGKLVVDQKGKIRSRGLNLKPDVVVFDEAVKRKVFSRTFNVGLTSENIAQLRKEFEECIDNRFREKKTVRISLSTLNNFGEGIKNE